MTEDAIRYLGDMEKLTVGPNDIIVIKLDCVVSDEVFRRVQEHAERIFGKGKVAVFDRGMSVGVISQDNGSTLSSLLKRKA